MDIGDEAVVATNDDAAICKYQAVLKGYYTDPFIDKLITNKAKTSMPRKPPEINRGYYARSASVAYIVEKFIESHADGQIISLGAGYDTLFWRLKSNGLMNYMDSEANEHNIKYVEIDMSSVVMHKLMSIRRHPDLYKSLSNITFRGEGLHSDYYHLISFDLRENEKDILERKLFDDCKLNPTKPTLCLAECVLVYMPIHDSCELIRWSSECFSKLTIVNYEQCNMADRFGDIMLANMNARHCDLMGVDACKSLNSQMNRFSENGLIHSKGWTLWEILNKCLSPETVERIFKIEFLDERELLEQLLHHYCIVIGSHQEIDWIPESQYWLSKTTA